MSGIRVVLVTGLVAGAAGLVTVIAGLVAGRAAHRLYRTGAGQS